MTALEEDLPKMLKASHVARLCGVDLKTVHNWVDKGNVAASRTPGRHLRFRYAAVIGLLEGMGFPIPAELRRGAKDEADGDAAAPSSEELTPP